MQPEQVESLLGRARLEDFGMSDECKLSANIAVAFSEHNRSSWRFGGRGNIRGNRTNDQMKIDASCSYWCGFTPPVNIVVNEAVLKYISRIAFGKPLGD